MFDFFFWRRELRPLPYTREMHCHLIPGVDDGSQRMKFTMEALAALENFGVEKVIFTPHYTNPSFLNYPDKIAPLFEEVKSEVKASDLEIECENFSFEYRMDKSFEDMVDAGAPGTPECQIRALKGNAILIENGWRHSYDNLEELVDKLKAQGYRPIMAHPERYSYFSGQRGEHYQRLHEMGIEFQCNILSFAGYYGAMEREMALWMLKNGYVSFLGSDMHNQRHIELIEKYLRSSEYADIEDDMIDSILNDRL